MTSRRSHEPRIPAKTVKLRKRRRMGDLRSRSRLRRGPRRRRSARRPRARPVERGRGRAAPRAPGPRTSGSPAPSSTARRSREQRVLREARRSPRPSRARARRARRPPRSRSPGRCARPPRRRSCGRRARGRARGPCPTMRGSRWVPPSISGTPQRRSVKPKRASRRRDPQVAPQRELEAAGQAPARDGGDRRLRRGEAREAERAAGRVARRACRSPSGRRRRRTPRSPAPVTTSTRAPSSSREARNAVVERLRRSAPSIALRRSGRSIVRTRSGAGALVPDWPATSRHARRRGRCAPWRPSCGGPCACRATHMSMLSRKISSGNAAIRMKPALVTTLSFVSPYEPSPPSCASATGALSASSEGGQQQRVQGAAHRAEYIACSPRSHGRRHRLRPRQGHGGRAAPARRLVPARAPGPDDAVRAQRLGQDDAAADAGGRDRRSTAASSSFAKGTRVALHDQRPPRERDLSLRDYVLSGAKELLAIEERLAELEHAMAEGATDDRHARRLRDRPGAARARRRLQLARGHQRDAARPRLPRRATSTARSRRSPAASSTRASLARALAGDPDLLLLDEPTNHLDIESLEWLETHLQTLDAAVVLVAHDRWFLEAVGTSVLELEAGRARFFKGTWHAWRKEKAARELALGRAIERQQEEIDRLERFVDALPRRHPRAPGAVARQAAGQDRAHRARPARRQVARLRLQAARALRPRRVRDGGRRAADRRPRRCCATPSCGSSAASTCR